MIEVTVYFPSGEYWTLDQEQGESFLRQLRADSAAPIVVQPAKHIELTVPRGSVEFITRVDKGKEDEWSL